MTLACHINSFILLNTPCTFELRHEKNCFFKRMTQISCAVATKLNSIVYSTILLLPNSEISNLWSCSVGVQPSLCWVLSGNPEDMFYHDLAHLSAMF